MGIRKNTIKIKTALISLSDKSNLRPLLNLLKKYKVKIISSGGTYKKIKNMGFDERFKRLWNFYLTYCESGFKSNRIDLLDVVPASIETINFFT